MRGRPWGQPLSEWIAEFIMTEHDPTPPLLISTELPCRRCRQLLYGLPVTADCPECGLPIEETLRTSIDLQSLHGQALEHPRKVAIAVIAFSLAAATALGAGILIPLVIAAGIFRPGYDDPRGVGLVGVTTTLGILTLLATLFALVGFVISLGPRSQFDPGNRHVGRWIRAIGIMLMATILSWVALLAGPAIRYGLGIPEDVLVLMADLVLGLGAIALILALDKLLRVIGARSEHYRRAGRGVQAARPMVTGIGISLLIGIAWLVGSGVTAGRWLEGQGEGLLFVRLALAGLLGVGGLYLLVNAAWATAPFWRGPWSFDQVVGAGRAAPPASMADDPTPEDTA